MQRRDFLATIIVTLLLLSGCGTTSSLNNASNSSDQAQYYLDKAKQTEGSQRFDWLLLATESLLVNKRTDKALAVLGTIKKNELSVKSKQLYYLLMAQSFTMASRTEQAFEQFREIREPELLKTYQQISYHSGYADILSQLLLHYESALQRISLSEILSDRLEIEENRELLWLSLMQVANLNIYRNSLNGILVSGWLELANLAKVYADQPDVLITKLELWRSMFNQHPANLQMPIDMARAEAARSYQPKVIALLLPESGNLANSAKTIRDGFLAAIYDIPLSNRPVIQFFDSSADVDIQVLYQQAVDQGANFVIGPLKRESVKKLSMMEYFPVPVMTINRLSEERLLSDNFYQFGLPVEDEARQVAIKAWNDGLSRALVLVPTGTVGERTSTAFISQFEQLGGEIQQVVSYTAGNDYSRAVQELLGVDKSIERFKTLQQISGIDLEHEARRRKDTDFLFFKANVNQARRIKPFIDFYYAHDLPLYSTSSVYSGKEEPILDRDLDNVLFCDIPWLLSEEYALVETKNKLSNIWPNSTKSGAARLFALGYDLFTLIPDLNRLRNFPQYHKQGLSGLLTVDQLGHIQRNLSWAKFIDGRAMQIENAQVIVSKISSSN